MLPPSGKGYYGHLERLKWGLDENMGMIGELDFGRTSSLARVVLLSNSGNYTPLLMNKASP
jgi:hypothetical protein